MAGGGDDEQTRDKQGAVEVEVEAEAEAAVVVVVGWLGLVEREEFPVVVADEVETAEE